MDENLNKIDNENGAEYYSIFTDAILKNLNNEDYFLKKGDQIIVTVENTNTTIGTMFKNLIYRVSGKERNEIWSSCTMPVGEDGIDNINISGGIANKEYAVSLAPTIRSELLDPGSPYNVYFPYNLYICLDISGSMATNDGSGVSNDDIDSGHSELASAKRATRDIMKQIEDFDKNSIKVIQFCMNENTKVIDSKDYSGSDTEIQNQMITKLNTIRTSAGEDSDFNGLLSLLKDEVNNSSSDGVYRNNKVIILSDGVTSDPLNEPATVLNDSILSLSDIHSIIYNEKFMTKYIIDDWTADGDPEWYVLVHPLITMGMISGYISTTEVYDGEFDYVKSIIKREGGHTDDNFRADGTYIDLAPVDEAAKLFKNCHLARDGAIEASFLIIMEQIMDETIRRLADMDMNPIETCTTNKILTVSRENINEAYAVTVKIDGEEKCSFVIDNIEAGSETAPDGITIDSVNVIIDFSKFGTITEEQNIRIEYFINEELLNIEPI